MFLLALASVLLFVSVYYLSRFALAQGARRWQEEKTVQLAAVGRSDFDWKRTMLALTYGALSRVNASPVLVRYAARIKSDNIAAGRPWDLDEREIVSVSELAFVATTVLVWFLAALWSGGFHPVLGLTVGILAGLAPGYLLAQQAVQRRIAINRALPFSLGLMVLAMEAGATFMESVQTLVDSDPTSPIAQEFAYFLQAVRHGKTRKAALEEMAERVQSDDLTPVVNAINTGEELGTPVGRILRIQADGIRGTRTQRAEKLAAEASSKILFPTLLIMIAVLLMLMGPVIIKGARGDWF